MARSKQKGGENGFLETTFAAGIGAFAAKNSSSMGELLWTLAKYSLVIIAIVVGVYIVMALIRIATTDYFIPVAPSKEGDEKVVTPAGNVILY